MGTSRGDRRRRARRSLIAAATATTLAAGASIPLDAAEASVVVADEVGPRAESGDGSGDLVTRIRSGRPGGTVETAVDGPRSHAVVEHRGERIVLVTDTSAPVLMAPRDTVVIVLPRRSEGADYAVTADPILAVTGPRIAFDGPHAGSVVYTLHLDWSHLARSVHLSAQARPSLPASATVTFEHSGAVTTVDVRLSPAGWAGW